MTTSAFPVLTDIENAFKTVVWEPMVLAGEVWIEGAVPFLNLPVIKQLDEAAIQGITDAVFYQIITFIDVTAIKFVKAELQNKWSTASESLALIAQEQGATSDAYKQALAVATTDFAQWIHTGP